MRYVSKKHSVDAVKFTYPPKTEVFEFITSGKIIVQKERHLNSIGKLAITFDDNTSLVVNEGSWIIKDLKGRYSAITNTEFKELYVEY